MQTAEYYDKFQLPGENIPVVNYTHSENNKQTRPA
jgi:hypothetical protein